MAEGRAQLWQLFLGSDYQGFKVYHYAAGTTTNKTVWADAGKTTALPQPATADSNGWITFYADGDYRLDVTDANGILLRTLDGVRITQDAPLIWEGSAGTSLPAADTLSKWQMFALHDGTDLTSVNVWNGAEWTNVADLSHSKFGMLDVTTDGSAKGDGITDDTAAVQAVIDEAALGEKTVVVFPPGEYVISQIHVPDGVLLTGVWPGGFGSAANDWATKLIQKSGTNDSMIVFDGHLAAGRYWSAYTGVQNMVLFGDTNATAGSAIHFKQPGGTVVVIQDYVRLHNLLIRGWKDHGIYFPSGATPLSVRDCVILFNDGWAIKFVAGAHLTLADQFDNISMDGNTLGGIYMEGSDDHGNAVFTNIKSEKRTNAMYGGDGNHKVLEFKDCNKMAVSIHGLASISSVVSGTSSGFADPGPVITISGSEVPEIHWAGVSMRVRNGTTSEGPGGSVLIDDTVDNRTVSYHRKQGTYNTHKILRGTWDAASLADGAGETAKIDALEMQEAVTFGEPIVGSLAIDTQGMTLGAAYMLNSTTPAFRIQNEAGSTIDLDSTTIKFLKLQEGMFKAQKAVAWSPGTVANGAQVLNGVSGMGGVVLGDFVTLTYTQNLNSCVVGAYVSQDGQIDAIIQNETGGAQGFTDGTLTVYALRESAFRYINSITYEPSVLSDTSGVTAPTIAVPGAVLGDFVMASFSNTLSGVLMSAWVSAADTVSVRFQNESGSQKTLGSGTLKVGVLDLHSMVVE